MDPRSGVRLSGRRDVVPKTVECEIHIHVSSPHIFGPLVRVQGSIYYVWIAIAIRVGISAATPFPSRSWLGLGGFPASVYL